MDLYMIEENEKIGLHDCRTNRIQYSNNVMTFEFPKGYYILKGKEPKQTGNTDPDQTGNIHRQTETVCLFMNRRCPEDIGANNKCHEHTRNQRNKTILFLFEKPYGSRHQGRCGKHLISPGKIVPEKTETLCADIGPPEQN